MSSFVGIGCMSGSSLDGLDICCVEFTGDLNSDLWGYRILKAETQPYSEGWAKLLAGAASLSGAEIIKLHTKYGRFVGETVSEFIDRHKLENVQFVSSHGHTVFHSPSEGFSFQLGDGETTSVFLKVPFVCDFRSKDVTLGGQGAPLVPCGEKYLFSNMDICVNLGGIANIGIKGTQGYDICPCNIVLNRLASVAYKGMLYDKDGIIAHSGKLLSPVMEKLHNLDFYRQPAPKSLWKEYIEDEVFPILDIKKYVPQDLLRTFTEHVAIRVADACAQAKANTCKNCVSPKVLVTGGGALNKYLMELVVAKLKPQQFEIEKVDETTINFKEALIFAFLGLRCLLGEENVFKSITGSTTDSISGSIHRPGKIGSVKQISLFHTN